MISMPQNSRHGNAPKTPCVGIPTETFFPTTDSRDAGRPNAVERNALRICAACPLGSRNICLERELTLPAGEQFGVVGGTTAAQRRAIIAVRRSNLAEVA